MYALLKLSGTLKAWQARYCRADYKSCARYQASLQGRRVPPNLMPNGVLLRVDSK
jgi:hypothetical protein